MKWFQRFAESLNRYIGKKEAKRVAKGWDTLPTGSSKHAQEQRTLWIKAAMESLDNQFDEEMKNRILIDTCPHSYPKTRINKMRSEFKRLGSVDDLLDVMLQDTSWGGTSFYDIPIRKGNIIYVTKVPFAPKAFRDAVTDDEKRLAYCHCSLVKRSKEPISHTFCCCSGGWVKQLWEGIFEMPVDVWLTKSLLKGDDHCTHAVQIPEEYS